MGEGRRQLAALSIAFLTAAGPWATVKSAWTPSTTPQEPGRLIAHYPLATDLNDATGNNPPIQATNAPFVAGRAIFCNGQYVRGAPDGCDVRTPDLRELNLSAFTITAQFLVPRLRTPTNPVFVGGDTYRWLFYDLRPDGAVRLGYNSNQFVDCSVKYRFGVWHEATMTFDGTTAALYLDGVGGCSSNVALSTGNQKTVMLTNSGNATAFYGMLRDLKVYNGVVVPARRTPVADSVPEPPPANLAPVDQLLMKCPTRTEVASIDADLRLTFDADPTKDEPLACTAAEGSRDLTAMKKRVYNSLLLMKQLQFDRPLPWTKEPLYKWFTDAVDGIRFRTDIKNSSCCGPGRTMNIAVASQSIRFTDRWVEPAMGGGLDVFILLLAHEARHADGYPHTCGTRDQTPNEMGSWGVQYYLARWLAEHADQSLFTSGKIRYTERMIRNADMLLKNSFCKP
jgi:Concanavalin A-like lectin/glucanases superfamily